MERIRTKLAVQNSPSRPTYAFLGDVLVKREAIALGLEIKTLSNTPADAAINIDNLFGFI